MIYLIKVMCGIRFNEQNTNDTRLPMIVGFLIRTLTFFNCYATRNFYEIKIETPGTGYMKMVLIYEI
jgi:hypothetical protein